VKPLWTTKPSVEWTIPPPQKAALNVTWIAVDGEYVKELRVTRSCRDVGGVDAGKAALVDMRSGIIDVEGPPTHLTLCGKLRRAALRLRTKVSSMRSPR
jgi:hypothetical protein